MSVHSNRRALVIGANRGLGLILTNELVRRGWQVTATTRQQGGELQTSADASNGQLTIESLEMTSSEQLVALRDRLAGTKFELLFISAGINLGNELIGEVSTEIFTEVMVTNALSPLRVLESLRSLVTSDGTLAIMSSGQGSISLNTDDGYEVYKASKAALNQLMRSYVNRTGDDEQTKLLIDPGHNQTSLGGFDAPLRPEESIPAVVDVLEAQAGAGGLQFLDRHGENVPW